MDIYKWTLAERKHKLIADSTLRLSLQPHTSGLIRSGEPSLYYGYGWIYTLSMGSITKAFTATAIMKLVEQNKLSVDDPLKKFFPMVPSDKSNITIHQLLTHSSGFHEFFKEDGGDYEKLNTETFLKTQLFDPLLIKRISYAYPQNVTDTIAIGYQNGMVWGTHQSHFEKAGGGPYWNLKGNGGLEASLNDMSLWANSFTNKTILKESTIEAMFNSHILEEGYDGQSYFGYGCLLYTSRCV